jgi:cob(I)alamin adenosyltransferase
MLYTKKGDNGTTRLFDCAQGVRLSKSTFVFEVLGIMDEINSSIGYAKVLSRKYKLSLCIKNKKISYEEILHIFQQNLFCIQAELGGSKIFIKKSHILFLEELIYEIETLLPPIKFFIIPGGGEAGAYLDIVRTLARKGERSLVMLKDRKEREVNNPSLEFLNRLSSALYALARFANYQEGYTEATPDYK